MHGETTFNSRHVNPIFSFFMSKATSVSFEALVRDFHHSSLEIRLRSSTDRDEAPSLSDRGHFQLGRLASTTASIRYREEKMLKSEEGHLIAILLAGNERYSV